MRSSPGFQSLFIVSLVLISVSCAGARKRQNAGADSAAPLVADEVSLKADRSQLSELRKDIPDEVQRENDELALVLNLMTNGDEEPSKIRERFNKAVRDRRSKMDKDLRKKREDFSRDERRKREDTLKKFKDERDAFAKDKHSSDERKRFFEDQELKRKDFFADQSDKRKAFESEMLETRKNFEDYVREKTNRFNQEIRAYTSTYNERRKAESLKKQSERKAQELARRQGQQGVIPTAQPGQPDPLEEFRQIPNTPAMPLAPSDQ